VKNNRHVISPLCKSPSALTLEIELISSVGRPKHTRVMAGALQDDLFIGRRAQEYRGLLKIKYPMEHGIVTDWDDMERIWGWVYGEGLKALSEEVSFLVLLVSEGD
jgi:actin-related protein